VKRESNHWWTVLVSKTVPGELLLRPGSERVDEPHDLWKLHDLCGQTCALKFISEQMGKAGESTNANTK